MSRLHAEAEAGTKHEHAVEEAIARLRRVFEQSKRQATYLGGKSYAPEDGREPRGVQSSRTTHLVTSREEALGEMNITSAYIVQSLRQAYRGRLDIDHSGIQMNSILLFDRYVSVHARRFVDDGEDGVFPFDLCDVSQTCLVISYKLHALQTHLPLRYILGQIYSEPDLEMLDVIERHILNILNWNALCPSPISIVRDVLFISLPGEDESSDELAKSKARVIDNASHLIRLALADCGRVAARYSPATIALAALCASVDHAAENVYQMWIKRQEILDATAVGECSAELLGLVGSTAPTRMRRKRTTSTRVAVVATELESVEVVKVTPVTP
ncbi:hypothetical protein THAOC_28862 [Thalassiosira oceanica]|uniref:Uncharacterized protein n=1 Tax=Thalassiosira oceanica TaxID=159749 RepID=K0RDU5_THAOC|nr:hypothetical protein THAOC_28862 [Thalassiosira oceanica]|eukprot:EJK51918.1 hypothetical protein THAOC_28862 [Thalassiosira oceanica]